MTDIEHGKLDVIASDVRDIKKAVFGNGRPGLCDRVAIVETAVKQLADSISPGARGNWIALAAVMVALISLFMSIKGG